MQLTEPAAGEPAAEQRVECGDARGEIGARFARIASAPDLGAQVAEQPVEIGAHGRGGGGDHGRSIFVSFSPPSNHFRL